MISVISKVLRDFECIASRDLRLFRFFPEAEMVVSVEGRGRLYTEQLGRKSRASVGSRERAVMTGRGKR